MKFDIVKLQMLQKIAHPEQHVARGPHLLHDLVKEAAQRRATATEASHGRQPWAGSGCAGRDRPAAGREKESSSLL